MLVLVQTLAPLHRDSADIKEILPLETASSIIQVAKALSVENSIEFSTSSQYTLCLVPGTSSYYLIEGTVLV